MYPDLYYLFRELFGVEWSFLHFLNIFGLFVALSFVAGAYFLRKEFLRKEAEGIFSDAAALIDPAKPAGVKPSESVASISFFCTIMGIFLGKLFYIFENYGTGNVTSLLFSFSGINFYGSLVGILLAAIIYYRYNNIKLSNIFDSSAPGLMLSYGTGRLGCHISGDGDWGIVNTTPKPFSFIPDWLWAYDYPHNVARQGIIMNQCDWGNYCYKLAEPVWPTSVYEFIACLILFLFLWKIRKKIPGPGFLMALYLILTGIERFSFEEIRVNPVINGLNLTQAQLVSILFVAFGAIWMAKILWRKKYSA
ncbi:MAG: prolipoprotein diacylglyceryl transferase [Niabella sp.]